MKHKVYVVMSLETDLTVDYEYPVVDSIWFLGRLAEERLRSLQLDSEDDAWIEEHYVS